MPPPPCQRIPASVARPSHVHDYMVEFAENSGYGNERACNCSQPATSIMSSPSLDPESGLA